MERPEFRDGPDKSAPQTAVVSAGKWWPVVTLCLPLIHRSVTMSRPRGLDYWGTPAWYFGTFDTASLDDS